MLRWSGFGSESVFQMSFDVDGMNVYVCACICVYLFVCVCENEDIIGAKHFLKRDYLYDSLRKFEWKLLRTNWSESRWFSSVNWHSRPNWQ